MKFFSVNKQLCFYLFLELYVCFNLSSQVPGKTTIKGSVIDAHTGEPVPYVSVSLKGTTVGTITDVNGKFILETSAAAKTIEFSFIGYQTESRNISGGMEQIFDIRLSLSVIALDEVRIKPQRLNYKNRNNPAVELIEKVIEKKDSNRQESFNYLEYKKYEKIQFALSNISEKFKRGSSSGKFSLVLNMLDTTKRIGNTILPVYIRESISDHYSQKDPQSEKEIINAEKTTNLNEYLDSKGVAGYLNYLYQDINIYDNEILFLTNKFLSPIAKTAPLFYKYYILDTLSVLNIKCIQLFFEPRNKEDFLFHGNLYIIMDSSYAVRKIDMGINKNINIDWVREMSITQDFEQFGQKGWYLSKDEVLINFGILEGMLGLYGQRTISYKDYKFNEPVDEKIFSGPDRVERLNTSSSSTDFWESNRYIPLTRSEKGIYTTIDSMKKIPEFKVRMKLLTLFTTGYLDLGDIELGPSESFLSYNSIEGTRLRFGGRTTTDFSKKITLEGYVAYGLNDNIFKYNAGVTYSLTPRTIFQFPVKSVRLNYQIDTRIPGQDLQFTQPDNIFLSFKRGPDDKLFLNKTIKTEFLNEFENHFSFLLGFSFTRQFPTGNLYFNTTDYLLLNNNVSNIDISEFTLNLRYAPDESFYQGKLYRFPFPGRDPVIQLKIAVGSKSIFNDFNYLRLQFSLSRRYYISILGYTDISFEAGNITGKVPYPLLFMHPANQTYSYQKNSYNLMNFLEFVSDKYVSLNIDHSFNGFFFNKVPLLKKLKLREVVTCKVVYGGLSNINNPDYQTDLLKFPVNTYGVQLIYTLENEPYVEASIGVSNVLRIFRIDLIKRFSHLNHPNVSDLGLRVQFRFDI